MFVRSMRLFPQYRFLFSFAGAFQIERRRELIESNAFQRHLIGEFGAILFQVGEICLFDVDIFLSDSAEKQIVHVSLAKVAEDVIVDIPPDSDVCLERMEENEKNFRSAPADVSKLVKMVSSRLLYPSTVDNRM